MISCTLTRSIIQCFARHYTDLVLAQHLFEHAAATRARCKRETRLLDLRLHPGRRNVRPVRIHSRRVTKLSSSQSGDEHTRASSTRGASTGAHYCSSSRSSRRTCVSSSSRADHPSHHRREPSPTNPLDGELSPQLIESTDSAPRKPH